MVKWLEREGDRVEKGDPLYELTADRITYEVEAGTTGVLVKILVAEDEWVGHRPQPLRGGH